MAVASLFRVLAVSATSSALLFLAGAVFAADAAPSKVLDEFTAAVQKREGAKEQIEKALAAVESMKGDAYSRSSAITAALRELYPDYQAALAALGEENLESAMAGLHKLITSDDPYLAADATFYLARANMLTERYEEALPFLSDISSKWAGKTLHGPEAMFLSGVSQARLLNRKEAIALLTKYLSENPDAPERMKIGAWRQLEQLKLVKDETITDVFERMDFSRRKLALQDAGKRTQEEQKKIVEVLAKLIKEAEEKECDCKGSGKGKGQGKGQGEGEGEGAAGKGQGKGKNGGGNAQAVDDPLKRMHREGPQSPWSKVRDRERDPAYSAIKTKFPSRYEKLIEQYYKSFQEDRE